MKRQMTVLSSIALGGLLVLNNSVDVNAAPALNPYNGVEAEVNFGQSGTKVVSDGDVKAVSSIDSGDYFIVKDVNFSKGVSKFKVNAKADSASLIEIRDGGADGDVIANIKIGATKGEYKEFVIDSSVKIDGKKTIAFVGKMGSVAIDKWSAVEASDDAEKEATEFPADPETGKTGEGDIVSPYDGITTEQIAKESKGVEQEDYKDKKVLTSLEQDDYYVVHNLKFDKGIAAFTASIKADEPSVVEVRADGVEGTLLAKIRVTGTDGEYKTFTAKAEEDVKEFNGTHAVVFVGKVGKVSIENWKAMHAPNAKTIDDKDGIGTPDNGNNGNKDEDKTNTGSGATLFPYNDISTGTNYGETKGIEYVDYDGNKVVSSLGAGDYFTVKDVDFKKGAAVINVKVKADKASMIELRDGGVDGKQYKRQV